MPYLDGLKVLDLTRLLPGPLCTMMLADLGADVLKIEDTAPGDYARYYPPIVGDVGAFFASVNRNKRAMTLNLKAARGRELLGELVADADVLVESFRPGVMERLGVGYEALRAINPRLVYCAISGYGQTGPYRERAGHDSGFLAKSGLLGLNARAGEVAHLTPFQLADLGGGALFGAFGICAALVGRARTGEGSLVDISMTEGALAFALPAMAMHAAGEPQTRGGNMLTGALPCYDVYATSDGRELAVAAIEPKFWAAFLSVIDRPDLAAGGLSTGAEAARVRAEIAAVLKTRTLAEWSAAFAQVDACVEPVANFDEVLQDAHLRARGVFFELNGIQQVRTPVTPVDRDHTPAPRHGEHTREVLEALGRLDEFDALREDGVI